MVITPKKVTRPQVVLIIEDTAEEIKKAKEASISHGLRPLVASSYEMYRKLAPILGNLHDKHEIELVGIVTDIHVPMWNKISPVYAHPRFQAALPNGLSVVATAKTISEDFDIPLRVCTDVSRHHFDIEPILESMGLKNAAEESGQVISLEKNWVDVFYSLALECELNGSEVEVTKGDLYLSGWNTDASELVDNDEGVEIDLDRVFKRPIGELEDLVIAFLQTPPMERVFFQHAMAAHSPNQGPKEKEACVMLDVIFNSILPSQEFYFVGIKDYPAQDMPEVFGMSMIHVC